MFRLCEITGHKHPDYLMHELTARQLNDWQLYQRQVGYRHDILWGMLTAAVTNQMRRKEDLVDPLDLMPYYDKPLLTAEQVDEKLKAMFEKTTGAN